MNTRSKFSDWYRKNLPKIKEDYFQFLRFASVSTDVAYRNDVLLCAKFLLKYLNDGDIKAKFIETSSYPVVYAEEMSAGKDAPTLLIYGHYDVQPPEPLDLWESPPFEPREEGGEIYARGASDNKGQIFYVILSLIAYKSMGIPLPLNIKLCIEGEEESNSMGLSKALPSLKEQLKCDHLLVVDFDSSRMGTPFITLGARGCLAMEFILKGSTQDFHSGIMGGVAYNPNRALAEILGSLWDKQGRVTVPGFYENVQDIKRPPSPDYPFTEETLASDFGLKAIGGEKGKSLEESNWHQPTLEINGMVGGYTDEGSKTVIPAKASVKITCRLVLDQDPEKIAQSLEGVFKEKVPKGMEVEVLRQGVARAFQSSPTSKLARGVERASSEVTGKKGAFVYSGGSIPIVAQFIEVLGVDAVGMGYALPTDQVHAPNEHFGMDRFEKGFLTMIRVFEYL